MAVAQAPKPGVNIPVTQPPVKGTGLALAVIAIAQLMIILDATVVNVA